MNTCLSNAPSEMKISEVGTITWTLNGQLHREDGPAMILSSGTSAWYWHGKCHRLDGPAVTYFNGLRQWCIDDKQYSYKDWVDQLPDQYKLLAMLST